MSLPNPINVTYVSPQSGDTFPFQYIVKDTDNIINIDTTHGEVHVILRNIRNSGILQYQTLLSINDGGNNAATNNITIYPSGGDIIQANTEFVLNNDGANSIIQISNINQWVVLSTVVPLGLDVDAANYINVAGFTNPSLITLINSFYIQLKATGLYSRFTHMKLNLTDSTTNATSLFQCSINGINPLVGQTIYTNNPTANYSGVTYNGVNQIGRLSYDPALDVQLGEQNTTLIAYAYSSEFAYLSWAQRSFGSGGTATNLGITSVNNGVTQNFINDAATIIFFDGLNTTSGFIGASRDDVFNEKYHFKNGVAITEVGIGTNGRCSIDVVEGGRTLDNVTIADYYSMRAQFVAFGQGFSVAEMSVLEPIINNFQGSIDTLFGLTGTNARKTY
jgi:hypothetical protein